MSSETRKRRKEALITVVLCVAQGYFGLMSAGSLAHVSYGGFDGVGR